MARENKKSVAKGDSPSSRYSDLIRTILLSKRSTALRYTQHIWKSPVTNTQLYKTKFFFLRKKSNPFLGPTSPVPLIRFICRFIHPSIPSLTQICTYPSHRPPNPPSYRIHPSIPQLRQTNPIPLIILHALIPRTQPSHFHQNAISQISSPAPFPPDTAIS